MIECKALYFSYTPEKAILKDAHLRIKPGECVALLGRNGEGKSTTLRLFAGLLKARKGEIHIGGLDPVSQRAALNQRLGLLPDGLGLFEELSLEAQLHLWGRVQGLDRSTCSKRIEDLASFLDFEELLWHPAKSVSQGTRKKAALAMALLHDPEYLLLDEPFEALDPASSEHVELLLKTAKRKTILFTAHDLELCKRLNARVILLNDGKLEDVRAENLDWRDFSDHSELKSLPSWIS